MPSSYSSPSNKRELLVQTGFLAKTLIGGCLTFVCLGLYFLFLFSSVHRAAERDVFIPVAIAISVVGLLGVYPAYRWYRSSRVWFKPTEYGFIVRDLNRSEEFYDAEVTEMGTVLTQLTVNDFGKVKKKYTCNIANELRRPNR